MRNPNAKNMALTTMQRAFVREYLLDPERDREKAAIRAGYSEDRAKRQADELLAQSDIRAAINVTVREMLQPFQVDKQSVLDRLVFNIQACRANGSDISSLAESRKTLELLGKHLGMFAEKVELDVSDKLIALLNSRRQKALPSAEPGTIPAVVVEPVETKPRTRGQVRKEVKREQKQQSVEAWKLLTQNKPN
jgi:phage terminase small subunit